MKHDHNEQTERLSGWLSAAGLQVDSESLSLIVAHARWLLEANRELNLTAVTDARDVLRLHSLDSLLVLPEVGSAAEGLLLDVGTGGGFPGLPLATALHRQVLLVDSVRKKAEALRRFVVHENLESWVSVSGDRTEALARERGAIASCVVARAVAELPALVELAAPLLVHGGTLVAMKGQPAEEELLRGSLAADQCGLTYEAKRVYQLPDGGEHRCVLTFTKTHESSRPLPRREGMATKRPLA